MESGIGDGNDGGDQSNRGGTVAGAVQLQTGNTTTEGSGRDLKKRRKDKSVGVARPAGALREKLDQLENSVLAVEQEMSDEKKSDSEVETTEAQSAVEKEKSVSPKREEM
ncbi:myosin-17-like [Dorcoceras hygrometricum]|uniref:Myosin-17-like n=1 Tax=Dorcoceras hygrometricum TaxID=472368 RepID=A0A2Z7CX73_9LAMI|nr:myosin-17-like [Dorcoceras hygrometricum]